MNHWIKLGALVIALSSCSRPSSIPTPGPVPTFPSTETKPAAVPATKQEWHLSPDQSQHSYQSTTRSTIKSADQSDIRESNNQIQSWFTISIKPLPKSVVFSGLVDSVQMTVPAGDTHFPVVFTGSLAGNELQLATASQNEQQQCVSRIGQVLGEVQPVISTVPLDLKAGTTWTDSINTAACAGEKIRTTTHSFRTYSIQGTTEIRGRQALAIIRSERIRLAGDGSQNQHQVHLQGEGTATTQLNIDTETGLLISAESNQQLRIAITASGRIQNFIQATQQVIDLIR